MQNYLGSCDLLRGVFSWDSWEIPIRKKAGTVVSKTADRKGIEMGASAELGAVYQMMLKGSVIAKRSAVYGFGRE